MNELTLRRAGVRARLGHQLGRGGEGAVYALGNFHDQVAKVYSSRPDERKVRKLSIMSESASPSLLSIAAWPTDLLVDRSGLVVGFAMPRLTARHDIHELYSPKSRAAVFPDADFRFLTHVAANVGRAFAAIHDQGHIIGDVNHGNVLVGPDGTVVLIDCDSFQVKNGQGVFTCDVGVPLFTPPELHGTSFRGLIRNQDHDSFGLAVMIFHLLFMGRHPFAGRYKGRGEMPIERAIAERRFAYSPNSDRLLMEPPPAALTLSDLGSPVSDLLIRAFSPSSASPGRPDARSWVRALETLSANLRQCPVAAWHHYPGHLSACPWCRIETQSGARLFGARIIIRESMGTVDINSLWRAIQAIKDPGSPDLPSSRPWRPPAGYESPKSGFLAKAMRRLFSPSEVSAAEAEFRRAKSEWASIMSAWQAQASRSAFEAKLTELKQIRNQLTQLPTERLKLLRALEDRRHEFQLRKYLDRFRIDRASISGIGPARTAMLLSYGVETAADVQFGKVVSIPGFGRELANRLLTWKQSHEKRFHFNPNEPVDPQEVARVNQSIQQREEALVSALRNGGSQLQRISAETIAAQQRLIPVAERAWTALQLAELHRKSI